MKNSTVIKIKPLSTNKAWQGKRFKTVAYKDYEEELLYRLPCNISIPSPPFHIDYVFGFSNKNSDLDNPVKLIQDILQKKYNFNDSNIYSSSTRKIITKKEEEFLYFKISHFMGITSIY